MALAATICVSLLALTSPSLGQVSVLTQHNDLQRTGQNLHETILNTSNVNVSTFGKIFARTVDGEIYAQPLYVPNLSVGGKTRNVVYAATQHNSVYAFDADDPAQSAPLWHVNLGTSVPSGDVCIGDTDPDDCPYLDINPEIGITSTPAIDPNTGIIYVVAKTKQTSNSTYHFFLHALDIKTGAERLSGPVEITASVTGGGVGSSGGVITLDPLHHLQRPALTLVNGVLYIGFGSVGDIGNYHGWLVAYDAAHLTPVPNNAVLNISPDGCCSGIWQSGQGMVADTANPPNLYLMTADGDFDADASGRDYGDSFLKISTSNGLQITDYFTPSNQATLFANNTDLGSGGPLLMPGTGLLVGIGKDRFVRVVDTTDLGQFNSAFDNVVQRFVGSPSPYFGSPVYWNSPNNGPVIYLFGPTDFLSAYKFVSGQFQTTPVSQSTVQNSAGFSNAAALSVSANSNLVGSGIVWTSASFSGKATGASVPGIMRAFDATDLTNELWNSKQNTARDDVGFYGKFSPPTIANGKVYLASFSNQLLVYGLLSAPDFSLSAAPGSATVVAGQPGASTISVNASNGFSGAVALTCSAGLPAGASCAFAPSSISPGTTSALTISTSATTPVGTYSVTINGASGGLNHTTAVSLTVNAVSPAPDFTIAGSALSPATVTGGGSATSTITVARLNAFSGAVALSCSVSPVVTPAPTCSFSNNSIAGGSGTSTLTVATSAATPAGAFTVTVTGTSGALSHTTSPAFALTVTAASSADFSVAASTPSPAAVSAGGSATSTITITPVNGFNAAVTLSCSVAPTVNPAPACAFNPASIPAGSNTSMLTVTTTSTTASLRPGSSGLFFAMLLPLGALVLAGGFDFRRKKLFALLLTALMLSGLIFLAACGGGGSSTPGGGGHATPPGNYTITITATSTPGSLTHTTTLTVTVR